MHWKNTYQRYASSLSGTGTRRQAGLNYLRTTLLKGRYAPSLQPGRVPSSAAFTRDTYTSYRWFSFVVQGASTVGTRKTGEQQGLRSLEREPRRMLYLIVKYGESWQFPLADRIHGQSMRRVSREDRCHTAHLQLHESGLALRTTVVYRGSIH